SFLNAGMRVVAPDLRGFGDTAKIPEGGYYHFPDYFFDVADLIDALEAQKPGLPLYLIGHSMGGTIATLYSRSFPDKVTKLALLEGVGPPDNTPEIAPTRMRRWISDVRTLRQKLQKETEESPRKIMDTKEALRRLQVNHPSVPVSVLESRLPHLIRDTSPN